MIKRYSNLVKLSHTIFALPFAMIGYTYALATTSYTFEGWVFLKILFCMLFARNAAMGFNRWADRDIDAENPRTQEREIPAGKLSEGDVMKFVIINALLFMATASSINALTAMLSPVALFIIFFYSYCKRFTAMAHLILGAGLSIAPTAAYISVTGDFSVGAIILSAVVLTWCAGFDIIYALQDRDFDRLKGLHSIPVSFSVRKALYISIALHAISAIALIAFAIIAPLSILIWVGVGLFIGILIAEHVIVTPTRQIHINMTFATLNGLASVVLAIFIMLGLIFAI